MTAFEQIKGLLAGLTEQELDAVESEIPLVRARRAGPGTQDAIGREVDRLLANVEARRAEVQQQWNAYPLKMLKSRLERFQAERLMMCACRECITGYVTLDVDRMCQTGKWQFSQELKEWRAHLSHRV